MASRRSPVRARLAPLSFPVRRVVRTDDAPAVVLQGTADGFEPLDPGFLHRHDVHRALATLAGARRDWDFALAGRRPNLGPPRGDSANRAPRKLLCLPAGYATSSTCRF
jgi:hypothetical protein